LTPRTCALPRRSWWILDRQPGYWPYPPVHGSTFQRDVSKSPLSSTQDREHRDNEGTPPDDPDSPRTPRVESPSRLAQNLRDGLVEKRKLREIPAIAVDRPAPVAGEHGFFDPDPPCLMGVFQVLVFDRTSAKQELPNLRERTRTRAFPRFSLHGCPSFRNLKRLRGDESIRVFMPFLVGAVQDRTAAFASRTASRGPSFHGSPWPGRMTSTARELLDRTEPPPALSQGASKPVLTEYCAGQRRTSVTTIGRRLVESIRCRHPYA